MSGNGARTLTSALCPSGGAGGTCRVRSSQPSVPCVCNSSRMFSGMDWPSSGSHCSAPYWKAWVTCPSYRNRRGRAHGRECELPEELAFAPGEQHLGNAGRGKNADVPGAAVGDVGQHFKTEPRQTHLDGRETEHVLRMGGGQAKDRRSTDVLPGEVNGADVESLDQLMQVFGRGLAVVLVAWLVGGIAETTQVDG